MDELQGHQPGHSEFQIERFIVARGNWTSYGRFKQTLREIEKRRRGLEDLQARLALLEIDLEDAVARERAPWSRIPGCLGFRRRTRRRAQIALDQLRSSVKRLRGEIAEVERETAHFERLARQLRPTVGELTDSRRQMLEEEMWEARVRAMASCDLMTRGNLSESTLDILSALPVAMRAAVLQEVRVTLFAIRQGLDGPLLEWLECRDAPQTRLCDRTAGGRELSAALSCEQS